MLYCTFRAQLPALLRIAQAFLSRQGLVNSTEQRPARLCEHPCPLPGLSQDSEFEFTCSRKVRAAHRRTGAAVEGGSLFMPCSRFYPNSAGAYCRSKLLLARKRFPWTLTRPQFHNSCKIAKHVQQMCLFRVFFSTALYAFARAGDLPRCFERSSHAPLEAHVPALTRCSPLLEWPFFVHHGHVLYEPFRLFCTASHLVIL